MRYLKGHSKTILVAIVTAAITAGVPVAARTVVDYARNANKVDGRHAVGAGASQERRAGKLVATNSKGYLPGGIIRRAKDSLALGGINPDRYAKKCGAGTNAGHFQIPGNELSDQWTEVTGSVLLHLTGGPPPGIDDCESEVVQARRVGPGVYDVNLSGYPGLCLPGWDIPAVTTARGDSPVTVTHETVCTEDNFTALRVHLWDSQSTPVDVPFDGVTLEPVLIPIP